MSLPAQEPVLAPAPGEYSQATFASWQLQLAMFFQRLNNKGPIVATSARLTALPTSSVGLASGELWNDAGTVKIVP